MGRTAFWLSNVLVAILNYHFESIFPFRAKVLNHSPLMQVLLHKAVRLLDVGFGLWQHLHQAFAPRVRWLAIHSVRSEQRRSQGSKVAGGMVVSHSSTFNADGNQVLQLFWVAKPQSNAH